MGAEDGQDAIAPLIRELLARRADVVGDQIEVFRLEVPRIDESDREGVAERRRALLDRLAIAADADPRVVRGQRDRDDPPDAVGGHPRQHVGDERVPVLHPGVDAVLRIHPLWRVPDCGLRISQRRLQLPAHLLGDRQQRRPPADQLVAMLQVFHPFRRGDTPAPDVGEIGLHVVRCLRCTIGH